jgi:hypothetical protein
MVKKQNSKLITVILCEALLLQQSTEKDPELIRVSVEKSIDSLARLHTLSEQFLAYSKSLLHWFHDHKANGSTRALKKTGTV